MVSPILEILSPIVETLSADVEMPSPIGEMYLIWVTLSPNFGETLYSKRGEFQLLSSLGPGSFDYTYYVQYTPSTLRALTNGFGTRS